jgi:hypothetical protein
MGRRDDDVDDDDDDDDDGGGDADDDDDNDDDDDDDDDDAYHSLAVGAVGVAGRLLKRRSPAGRAAREFMGRRVLGEFGA